MQNRWFISLVVAVSFLSAMAEWLPLTSFRLNSTEYFDETRNLTIVLPVKVKTLESDSDTVRLQPKKKYESENKTVSGDLKIGRQAAVSEAPEELPEENHDDVPHLEDSLPAEDTTTAEVLDPSELFLNHSLPNVELSTEQTLETLTELMDEVIVLPRNNCNFEIHVNEAEDRKIRIQFGQMQRNTIGQCQITLIGEDSVMLAVYITDVRLRQAAAPQQRCQGYETLRVVLTNTGINFTLKQYCGDEDHYPVLLTDTNRAYLMLSYNSTNIPDSEQDSRFDLEAFSYHKHQNQVGTQSQNQIVTPFYPDSVNKDIESIYITTDDPHDER